jgi:hypothetical protein
VGEAQFWKEKTSTLFSVANTSFNSDTKDAMAKPWTTVLYKASVSVLSDDHLQNCSSIFPVCKQIITTSWEFLSCDAPHQSYITCSLLQPASSSRTVVTPGYSVTTRKTIIQIHKYCHYLNF